MSKQFEHKEQKNVYALDQNLNKIFVKKAVNGRNLYSCMGCKREVLMVRRKSFWHFRHYVESDSEIIKCTYNDETFRHELAKNILQIHKKIKVPTLYKFSPNVNDGLPKILQSTRIIEAHSVKNEVFFFENNNGDLKFGSKEDSNNMNLLIKADSAFFDEDGKPILIIEFIATHKLTEEKKIKIKRLGIDTIQVSIPKDSPEAIEEILLKDTSRTKWIYSYEEQNAEYFSVSSMAEDGIYGIDEKQRDFFDEGFTCRKARINNLLFSIGKSLESEQHREIDGSFESEISRVQKNTERIRDDEKGLRETISNISELEEAQEGERREIDIINSIVESTQTENYSRFEKEDFDRIGIRRDFNEFFTYRELFDDFAKEKCDNVRLRKAKEFFKSGAHKNWDDVR